MLQRKNGATLPEIVKTMGWQKHTMRGFMAGAIKKAGSGGVLGGTGGVPAPIHPRTFTSAAVAAPP
jgi:hypothetical protein